MNHEPEIERRMVKDLLYVRIFEQACHPGRPCIIDADDSDANSFSKYLTRSEAIVTPAQASSLDIPCNARRSCKGRGEAVRKIAAQDLDGTLATHQGEDSPWEVGISAASHNTARSVSQDSWLVSGSQRGPRPRRRLASRRRAPGTARLLHAGGDAGLGLPSPVLRDPVPSGR